MKLIQQSADIWVQPSGLEGVYKQIEKSARLCYRSNDKITENSYTDFIIMLEKRKHFSPLEHGTVYLKIPNDHPNAIYYMANPYSKTILFGDTYYVTTNMRVIKEHHLEKDLVKYLCDPTEHHEKRISVHIVTSRSISHELVRHKILCVA